MISSISESYYKLEAKKKGLGILFTLICWGLVFILVPNLLTITKEPYQFLIFLAGGGLGFVGAAPLFKLKPDKLIHCLGAIICMLSSQLWCILNYYPIVITGWSFYILYFIFKRTNYIFWAEITAIIILFFTILTIIR